MPSDNLLRQLRTLDLLLELDTGIVQNVKNLDAAFRKEPFDPGNRFSVPWATGTTGIGYDATVFSTPPDWSVYLDDTHAGKMTILDEMRDAFGLALFLAGEDPNTRDPATIDAAAYQLIAMKAIISGFDSATYLDRSATGELVCAHAYSTDVLQAKERNPNLAYVLPQQGGLRWIDSLCIPTVRPTPTGRTVSSTSTWSPRCRHPTQWRARSTRATPRHGSSSRRRSWTIRRSSPRPRRSLSWSSPKIWAKTTSCTKTSGPG